MLRKILAFAFVCSLLGVGYLGTAAYAANPKKVLQMTAEEFASKKRFLLKAITLAQQHKKQWCKGNDAEICHVQYNAIVVNIGNLISNLDAMESIVEMEPSELREKLVGATWLDWYNAEVKVLEGRADFIDVLFDPSKQR